MLPIAQYCTGGENLKTGLQLMDEINNTKLKHGECAFWWLGQMGYVLKLGKVTLAIDPFLAEDHGRLMPPPIKADALKVDYILGTHDHGDHIDRGAWAVIANRYPQTRFIAPSPIVGELAYALRIGPDRLFGVSEGTHAMEEPGLHITGIASAHEFLRQDELGEYMFTGYLIRANGLAIYHAGDCLKYEGLETKLLKESPLDVMFLPINGRDGQRYRANCIGNMTFQEAVDLSGVVSPALTVPGHYGMFSSNTVDPSEFADYLEAKYPERRYWIGECASIQRYHKQTDVNRNTVCK
jgi:L-ascorbate 6-phosphate lactonase